MPGKLEKATLEPTEEGAQFAPIKVLFNPAEYSLERSNQFQSNALPGLSSPVIQFVNGNADTLSMELFLDTYTDGGRASVTDVTDRIGALLEIDSKTHAPPVVIFKWGKFQFQAVLERLGQKFTMFLEDGTPVRATLSVTFREYRTVEEQLNRAGLASADVTKRTLVEEQDRLWWLAHREYGDAGEWRLIAEANGIDNPRLLEVGSELRLPPLRRNDGRRP